MADTHIEQRTQIAADLDFEEQCEAAVAAHGEWKYKLLKAIDNKGEGLDPAKIEVDNQCVFGKWLYSDKTVPYRAEADYESVRRLHAEFHRHTASIVRLYQSGELRRAQEEIAENSLYSQISARLAAAVERWVHTRRGQAIEQSASAASAAQTEAAVVLRYALRGAVYGAVFGFMFVFGGIVLACIKNSLPLQLTSLVTAHQLAPLQYIIDSAPLVLGVFGYFLGRAFGKNHVIRSTQEALIAVRTQALRDSMREMELMREHITDGLFILDRELKIGKAYSRALVDILETTDLADRSLLLVLKGRLSHEKEEELKGYLDLLLNSSHDEAMLRDLNPLNPLELAAEAGAGRKILAIQFARIKDSSGKVTHLLAVARDITQETEQRERVAQLEAERNEEIELIRQILSLGPAVVFEVKEQMRLEAERISELLKNTAGTEISKVLEAIFRHVHTIKGAASLMGFSEVARIAHSYEEKLAQLRKQTLQDSAALLGLMVYHGELIKALRKMGTTIEKIESFKSATTEEQSGFVALLRRATEAAADAQQKRIEFNAGFTDVSGIEPHKLALLRDIFIQFIRNSAAHGIEAHAVREARGKNPTGKITLSREVSNTGEIWIYRDDGAGFDVEAIKRKAIERHLLDPDRAAKLSDKEIVQFILQPGFSTKEDADMTSGRGVGMDLVANLVKELKGKLSLRWRKGEYTEFRIALPLHKEKY